jgi:hypothetical protein
MRGGLLSCSGSVSAGSFSLTHALPYNSTYLYIGEVNSFKTSYDNQFWNHWNNIKLRDFWRKFSLYIPDWDTIKSRSVVSFKLSMKREDKPLFLPIILVPYPSLADCLLAALLTVKYNAFTARTILFFCSEDWTLCTQSQLSLSSRLLIKPCSRLSLHL